jgi:hypothetical protein
MDIACMSDLPTTVDAHILADAYPVYTRFLRHRSDPIVPEYAQANLSLHNYMIPGSVALGMRRIRAVNHLNDIVMRSIEMFDLSPQLTAEICLLSVWLKWEICIDQQAHVYDVAVPIAI